MSEPAVFVVLEDGGYRHVYSRWRAPWILIELFWGPDALIDGLAQEELADEWYDPVNIEGGALIDPRGRSLLLFGSGELMFDIPMRRLYLELIALVWAGWSLRWADDGLADFNRALSIETPPPAAPRAPEPLPDLDAVRPRCLGSLARAEGPAALYPLKAWPEALLRAGPELLDYLELADPLAAFEVDWGDSDNEVEGGLHIDPAAKCLGLWQVTWGRDLAGMMSEVWPGWRLERQGDRFECQSEATAGGLRFITPDRGALLRRLWSMLLPRSMEEPVTDLFDFLAEHPDIDEESGRAAAMSRHEPHLILPPRKARAEILIRAVDALQKRGEAV